MITDRNGWVKIAIEAAKKGGDVLNSYFRSVDPSTIEAKHVGDWVSDADRASEKAIVEFLTDKVPGHDILTEETGMISGSVGTEYCWIIDPLDGTTNFLRGFPVWAVSVALEYRPEPDKRWGRIVAGAIYIPPTDEMFYAVEGDGAFVNGERIRVSSDRSFQESLLATGFPFRTRDLAGQYIRLFGDILPRCGDVRRAGAVAVDLCYTAAGIFDGFWELDLAPWDIAAGALIIKEAGGMVSNFQAGGDFLSTGDIVAGNPDIFGELIEYVKRYFPDPRNVNKAPGNR